MNTILARLDDFRGASRFTTWAYKFALLEAAVKLRRRAWQGRELPLEPESWTLVPSFRTSARSRPPSWTPCGTGSPASRSSASRS